MARVHFQFPVVGDVLHARGDKTEVDDFLFQVMDQTVVVSMDDLFSQFKNGIEDEVQMAVAEVGELLKQIVDGGDAEVFIFLITNVFDYLVQFHQQLRVVIDCAGQVQKVENVAELLGSMFKRVYLALKSLDDVTKGEGIVAEFLPIFGIVSQ